MATLSGLEIGSLTLNPSFQPDVYDYTATRAQGDTSTGTIKLTKTHNSSVIGQGMFFGSATHIGPHSQTTTFINNASQSGENPATRNGVDYRTTTTQLSFMVSNGNDSREYTVVIGRTSVTAIAQQDAVAIGDTVVMTASVENYTGTLSYQWQISQNGGLSWNNSVLTGNKTDTYSFTADAARLGRLYRCAVTDDNGTWYSNTIQLDVLDE